MITSLAMQREDFDRLEYLPLQSSDHEAFNDTTRKDNEANFSKSNWSNCNQWVPGKQVHRLCYIYCSSHHFKHDCPYGNDNAYLQGGKNDSHSKQNYCQQRHGHQNNN